MTRRLLPAMLAACLAVILLAPTAVAAPQSVGAAPQSEATSIVVLAAEGGEEPAGAEPRGPNDTENSFAPDEYEAPFLINAAWGLSALMVLLAAGIGGLYWLLVQRPKAASSTN